MTEKFLVIHNEKVRGIFTDREEAENYIDYLGFIYGYENDENLKVKKISEEKLKKDIDKLEWLC